MEFLVFSRHHPLPTPPEPIVGPFSVPDLYATNDTEHFSLKMEIPNRLDNDLNFNIAMWPLGRPDFIPLKLPLDTWCGLGLLVRCS